MSLEKIPIIFNNKQLQELKQEAQIIEQTYWDLKEKARINDNNTLKDELKEVEEKRAKIKENIYMLEKSILEMQSSFVKISAEGNLSKRQIYAQKCLEQGDIEAAKQALKLEDIKEEAHKILDLHEARKEELQIKINELIQRIETLKLDTKNPDRFLQIEETFVEALKIEKQGGLYRKTILIYAQYLYNIKEFEKAIETGQKFISYLELEEIENKENLGNSYNIMGKSYSNLQDYKQAEQNLQKYIQIAEDLKDYEQIIEAYNNIIEYVYNKTNEYDKIEKYYEKLIEVYQNNIKSENRSSIMNVLKKVDAAQLLVMKLRDVESFTYNGLNSEWLNNAYWSSEKNEIFLGETTVTDSQDAFIRRNFPVLSHEYGHFIDTTAEQQLSASISSNQNLEKTFREEYEAFLQVATTEEEGFVDYFTGSSQGADRGAEERVAETNMLLRSNPDEMTATRAYYLQRYFPRTVAAIADEISKIEQMAAEK